MKSITVSNLRSNLRKHLDDVSVKEVKDGETIEVDTEKILSNS